MGIERNGNMEKQKKNWISLVIWIYLFLGPIFDVITSFSIHYTGKSLFLILGIKVLFLIFLFGVLCYVRDKKCIWYSILLAIYFVFFFLILYYQKGGACFLLEAQNIFRTFYFPCVFFFLFSLYQRNLFQISKKFLVFILILYLSFLVVPEFLGFGFPSYAYSKAGSLGWFYSTNEIGGILAILGPFLFVSLKKMSWYQRIFSVILYLLGILVIGTKVPILAFFLIIFSFLGSYFYQLGKAKKWKVLCLDLLFVIIGVVVFSLVLVHSSFYKNIQIHMDFLGIHQVRDLFEFHNIDHFIFSERLSFWQDTREIYHSSSFLNQVMGIGITEMVNGGVQSMKMIEMDYLDLFYHYGVIGTLLWCIPCCLLWQKRKWFLEEKISFLLIVLLSFFSGHILVAPSVSVLVALVCIPKKKEECLE